MKFSRCISPRPIRTWAIALTVCTAQQLIPSTHSAYALPGEPRQLDSADYELCTGCSLLPDTVTGQFKYMADCLTGPDVRTGDGCGCADLVPDGHVTLEDFAAFQNFPMQVCLRQLEIWQTPAEGYCPTPGTIDRASLIPTLQGPPVLVGTLTALGDPDVDECLFGLRYDCFVAVPFVPRLLSPSEVSTLNSLLQQIPAGPTECDYAWDPCMITSLRFETRFLDDYCYGSPDAWSYHEAIQNVLNYLSQLATSP